MQWRENSNAENLCYETDRFSSTKPNYSKRFNKVWTFKTENYVKFPIKKIEIFGTLQCKQTYAKYVT